MTTQPSFLDDSTLPTSYAIDANDRDGDESTTDDARVVEANARCAPTRVADEQTSDARSHGGGWRTSE